MSTASVDQDLAERSDVGTGGVAEHHRPGYHPRPPRGYLNDPNGPVVVGDLTHLYFQSRPTTDVASPVEWGHLTSSDLVRWRLHRPAMAPVPDGPDADGCYSGNTVLDDGRVRAFYSGYRRESPFQSVLTALSDDGGYTFGAPTQVVPDPAPDEDAVMFRDPFVWRTDDGWRLVVGAGYRDGRSAVRLYSSPDLQSWSRLADAVQLDRQPGAGPLAGDAWECPQVLELAGRSIVVMGTWSFASGVNRVVSAELGAEPVRPEVVDHGASFYAASALRDSGAGPVLFGWVREARDPDRWIAAGWAGALALPRQVWLGADGSVRSAPVPAASGLRAGAPLPADGASVGAQCEIVVPTAPARISLHFGSEERLVVDLDAVSGSLTVEAATAELAPDAASASAADAFDERSDRPAARIFVDGSIVEVFTSAGRVLTSRVYPSQPPPWRVEATAGAEVWELDSGRPA